MEEVPRLPGKAPEAVIDKIIEMKAASQASFRDTKVPRTVRRKVTGHLVDALTTTYVARRGGFVIPRQVVRQMEENHKSRMRELLGKHVTPKLREQLVEEHARNVIRFKRFLANQLKIERG